MRFEVTDFTHYRQDRFIDCQTGPGVRLAPTILLTNEMGMDNGFCEELSDTCWARVIFHLPSARVRGAELLFYVRDDERTQTEPMRLLVNGHEVMHRQDKERMLIGGWDRTDVPAEYLVEGCNEFVFTHNGVLFVDPGPGGCSSRSFNAGQTWHEDALGPDENRRGEYMVRLRLKGHPPCGRLTSPVVDLADPHGEGRIAPRTEIGPVQLTSEFEAPRGTRVEFEMRSGSTPAFEARSWTPWGEREELGAPARFVQWRATLRTESAETTPVLKGVTLQAEAPEGQDSTGAQLLELDHPEIIRSSYDFEYLGPHLRVERLRKEYRLEEVVARGSNELERFALLRDWVHSQWLGWQSSKYPYCPPWDPIEILQTTKGNWGFGMCTHYAAVFTACAAALGYVCRVVIIDHHCLTEIWSEELQRWILQDPGPARDHDATYELDGRPLNALEVHRVRARGDADRLQANKLLANERSLGRIEPMGKLSKNFCRFAIPLRNDHTVRASPAEDQHGNGQYHWDGYLWWSDEIDPKYPEYSLQSSREGDFYWSVNQTRIYLQAAERDEVLRVDLETVTPNFSHYLVQIDDGEWQKQDVPLEWTLHQGENSLAVRSVNAFGRAGRVSRARVSARS